MSKVSEFFELIDRVRNGEATPAERDYVVEKLDVMAKDKERDARERQAISTILSVILAKEYKLPKREEKPS